MDLNVDAMVRSEFFPPKGPIRATEFSLNNMTKKQIRKHREYRILAHKTKQKT